MAWDTSKNAGDTILSADWNSMVTDQKAHAAEHESGGRDALTLTNIDSKACIINSGSYSGNAAANRAIPHGLGKTPKYILIVNAGSYPSAQFSLFGGVATIFALDDAWSNNLAVTAPDATNFYVGNAADYAASANTNTETYYWVAWS